MITDKETNFLYLADILPKRYPAFYEQLEEVLIKHGIEYGLLPNTKDIWARDYMPIQISLDRYVQFTYNPDYLQSAKWLKTISDTDSICEVIGVKPEKSCIVVDGGNVVKASEKVIMCSKVFTENAHLPEKQLIHTLKDMLEVEQIVFIPTDPYDTIGHADGMVRFLDETTVLINDYSREKPAFQLAFRMALQNAGLDWIEIPYNPYNNSKSIQAIGIYINYLQMQDIVIVPTFNIKEDEVVVKQFKQLFTGSTIATLECKEISKEGGILNCITWNMKSKADNI